MNKEQPTNGRAAYAAGAVIEGAPMTAAEIAAQAREEQSAQRGEREQELEAQKEDAERQLADEFDEMEDLEARLRKLREKREALRTAPAQRTGEEDIVPEANTAIQEDEQSDSDEED